MGDLGTGLLGSCRRGSQVGETSLQCSVQDGGGLEAVGPLTRRQGKLMPLSGGEMFSLVILVWTKMQTKGKMHKAFADRSVHGYGYLVVASAPYH